MDDSRRPRGALERQVMAVLTAADGALSPAEVRARLGDDLAYTTVMTVLARLFGKGLLTRHRDGRAYLYRRLDGDAQVAAHRMHRLLTAGPNRAAVLRQFVDTLSADDEQLLTQLLRHAGGGEDSP
ncbi:BlaI/MecI/CopY family transcriptional regulator [Plantactinospora siamensis]|uniref:BlaI/MecI/CopY family transcriptional regulator n=1 Tax=Plantactinospora siamensis TaxID=555372 RepID=A0ABV6P3Z6_9ACTN